MAYDYLKILQKLTKAWGLAVGEQDALFNQQPMDYVDALLALDGKDRQAGEYGLSWTHLTVLALQCIHTEAQFGSLKNEPALNISPYCTKLQSLDYFNQRTAFGQTPLHLMAATWNLNNTEPSKEMVSAFDIILAHPTTDLDARDFEGNTPLHYATFNPTHEIIIRKLLAAGADPLVLNRHGAVPADLSAARSTPTNEASCRLRDAHFAAIAAALVDEAISPPPDDDAARQRQRLLAAFRV